MRLCRRSDPLRGYSEGAIRPGADNKVCVPSLALWGLLVCLATAACGSSGPPPIEEAREGIPAAYHIVYAGEDGKTVLELLQEHAGSVVTESHGDDILVTNINEVEAGFEGRYWVYYVNEQAGAVAANRMDTVEGDSIEWLFVR